MTAIGTSRHARDGPYRIPSMGDGARVAGHVRCKRNSDRVHAAFAKQSSMPSRGSPRLIWRQVSDQSYRGMVAARRV